MIMIVDTSNVAQNLFKTRNIDQKSILFIHVLMSIAMLSHVS